MSKDLSRLDPKRILVCQLRQIGDVIISTLCVEMLAERWPGAEIHFLTEAKCAPVLEHNPRLDRIWTVKNPHGPGDLRTHSGLSRQGFDLAVDFQQLPRARWAMLFSRAPVRLTAQARGFRRLFYTHFSHAPAKGGYAGKIKAGVLEPLGLHWSTENRPRLFLHHTETAWAKEHLRDSGLGPGETLVAVDATHWSDTRRWFPEGYAVALGMAAQERPDLKFYLLHGPGERDQVQAILEQCPASDRCILPPDEPPSLRRTMAIIAQSSLLVGNCSAPRHMAVALGVPSLVLVGSNGNTAWNFPSPEHGNIDKRVPCRKCNKNVCPTGTLDCLKAIEPEEVARRLTAMLREHP